MIHGRRHRRVDAVALMLDECAAAADAHHETPLAHVVEQADLLVKAQRMVQRQHVDQGAEFDEPRASECGREEHARACRHAERGRMVLGKMITGEAFLFDQLNELQAIFQECAKCGSVAVEMVENSEFEHISSSGGAVAIRQRWVLWASNARLYILDPN